MHDAPQNSPCLCDLQLFISCMGAVFSSALAACLAADGADAPTRTRQERAATVITAAYVRRHNKLLEGRRVGEALVGKSVSIVASADSAASSRTRNPRALSRAALQCANLCLAVRAAAHAIGSARSTASSYGTIPRATLQERTLKRHHHRQRLLVVLCTI